MKAKIVGKMMRDCPTCKKETDHRQKMGGMVCNVCNTVNNEISS